MRGSAFSSATIAVLGAGIGAGCGGADNRSDTPPETSTGGPGDETGQATTSAGSTDLGELLDVGEGMEGDMGCRGIDFLFVVDNSGSRLSAV